jgi:hypothetical protein
MKAKCFKICVLLFLFISGLFFFCRFFKSFEDSKLKLWMSYNEVAKILPHDRNLLQRSPVADDYVHNQEERKCLPIYGLDLEIEYGLILGFNEYLELVLINRVTRAEVLNPSGGVPVLQRRKE